MSNRFYFDSDSSDSGDDNLPYPKPLSRSSFLTPDFDPATFLSSLENRHQTLEDLRAELKTRSLELNKELLDLVNENYQDFLSLGSSLKGGDEKVEEVRLGLLGFKREIEGLKDQFEETKREVKTLVDQRKAIRAQIQTGRTLLEVDQRLCDLEKRLMIVSDGLVKESPSEDYEFDPSDSDEESDGEQNRGMSTTRLRKHAQQYLYIRKMIARIGPDHPFLVNQEGRVTRLKNTILLDLRSALQQSRGSDEEGKERVMRILEIYRDLDESKEAVKVLKDGSRP